MRRRVDALIGGADVLGWRAVLLSGGLGGPPAVPGHWLRCGGDRDRQDGAGEPDWLARHHKNRDTSMPRATRAMALSAITADTAYARETEWAARLTQFRTVVSELLDPDRLLTLGRARLLHGQDKSDAAGVVLVLDRAGGIEKIGVFGDQ